MEHLLAYMRPWVQFPALPKKEKMKSSKKNGAIHYMSLINKMGHSTRSKNTENAKHTEATELVHSALQ